MDLTTILKILTGIALESIGAIQNISGKSRDEVLDAIRDESAKTDELLAKLRPKP